VILHRLGWRCLSLFFSSSSLGNSRHIEGVNVVIKPGNSFTIGDLWSAETKAKLIGRGKVTLAEKAGVFLDETPFFSWLTYSLNKEKNFKKMGQEIAANCKKKDGKDVMKLISCVANSVNSTLKQTGWPDDTSFCRSHDTAFRIAFNALQIPRSHVFQIGASTDLAPHAVSHFILTSVNGQAYSYVIDVGNAPKKLFPKTKITELFHKRNLNTFPEFKFSEQQYRFEPAFKSVPKVAQ